MPVLMTFEERIGSAARRQLHSGKITIIYLLMTLLSLMLVIWTFIVQCPGFLFYLIDGILTLLMTFDLSLRIMAIGWAKFKKGWVNILDLLVLILCIGLISISDGCNAENRIERDLDTIILTIRNFIQCTRLYLIFRKNQMKISQKESRIELPMTSFSQQNIRLEDIKLDDLIKDGDDILDGNYHYPGSGNSNSGSNMNINNSNNKIDGSNVIQQS